ncbi:MAG: hypothetical protein HOH77_13295 [Candidatus Latescibacteria bacterium]|nr:hypothetical protein [Candidatus Latescibacterota bacterium]
MQLHLVGGFLGSGKTTAIIAAAQHLIKSGKRVGIVTNDQGKYLVDTAFVKSAHIPTVEVTGGCFCCNYDDLETVLKQLDTEAQPDVIFAESVGSCADLVATVVKPLQTFYQTGLEVSSLSIFTDIRLLRRRLQNQPLPFHENVVYIFDKQIEEAGLIILNKADLLSEEEVIETLTLAQQKYPHKPLQAQNTLIDKDIQHWLERITSDKKCLPTDTLDIDYEKYGAGEAELAWLDEEIEVQVTPNEGRYAMVCFLEELHQNIQQRNFPIGHLKIWVKAKDNPFKLSFTTLLQNNWQDEIPHFRADKFSLLINLRAQAPMRILREVVCESIEVLCWNVGAICLEKNVETFHPTLPTPIHRMQ